MSSGIAPEQQAPSVEQATDTEDEETQAVQEITAALEPEMKTLPQPVVQTASEAAEPQIVPESAPVAEEESLPSSHENSPKPKRRRVHEAVGLRA